MNDGQSSRTEFGAVRTVCACGECRINCEFIPGFLIPADLTRMIPVDQDPFAWAKANLLASPGAVVMHDGEVKRVHTLVPAVNRETKACIHLQDGRCAIHEIAPFGCAFFDHSTPPQDELSHQGLKAIMKAWREDGLYAKLWKYLDTHGRRQKEPSALRRQMTKALNERETHTR